MRDAGDQAKKTYKAQDAAAKLYGNNAANSYSLLMPQYAQMALNPQGLSPTDQAKLNTSAMQAGGGATAAAVTQGNLQAARTGNVGGYQTSLSEASRLGGKLATDAALKIDGENAELKERQRVAGLSGLSGLNSEYLRAANQELNAENESTRTLVDANNSGWLQNLTGLMTSLNGAGYKSGGKSWTL